MTEKEKLKKIIEGLDLDPEVQGYLFKYIEENESSEEVRENVAQFLELLAEHDQIRAELLNDLALGLDKLTDKQISLVEKSATDMARGLKELVSQLKQKVS